MTPRSEARYVVACYDDHPIVLDGVCRILESSGKFDVRARGHSVGDLERDLAEFQPDILFLDLAMPGDVLGYIRRTAGEAGAPAAIVFTANGDSEIALRCLEAGARGFLVKDSLGDELIDAASRVMEGNIHISMRHAGRIMLDLSSNARRTNEHEATRLSPREEQIVKLVAIAMSNKEIARELAISEKTVKNHMTNLMEKLGARNRTEVAILARGTDQSSSEESS